jgi:hypothetical protein
MNTQTVEQIVPGLTLQQHANGQIFEYTLTHLSPPIVDAWVARIAAEAELQPKNAPRFTIQDISQSKTIMVPPYVREKVKVMLNGLVAKGIQFTSYTAIILPRNFMTHFVRLLMNSIGVSSTNTQRIFFNRSDGLAWLEEKLKEYQSTGGTI